MITPQLFNSNSHAHPATIQYVHSEARSGNNVATGDGERSAARATEEQERMALQHQQQHHRHLERPGESTRASELATSKRHIANDGAGIGARARDEHQRPPLKPQPTLNSSLVGLSSLHRKWPNQEYTLLPCGPCNKYERTKQKTEHLDNEPCPGGSACFPTPSRGGAATVCCAVLVLPTALGRVVGKNNNLTASGR